MKRRDLIIPALLTLLVSITACREEFPERKMNKDYTGIWYHSDGEGKRTRLTATDRTYMISKAGDHAPEYYRQVEKGKIRHFGSDELHIIPQQVRKKVEGSYRWINRKTLTEEYVRSYRYPPLWAEMKAEQEFEPRIVLYHKPAGDRLILGERIFHRDPSAAQGG